MSKLSRHNGRRPKLSLVFLALLAVVSLSVAGYALAGPHVPLAEAPVTRPAPVRTTEAAEPVPVVAFIGDSYTAGTGVTATHLRWTTRLSLTAGWKEANLGRGGSGYLITNTTPEGVVRPNYETMIAEAVKAKPNVVVVSGGGNDLAMPISDVQAAVTGFYPALRKALPKATIIAVNPLWRAAEPPSTLATLHDTIKAAVSGVKGTFIDIGQPLHGHPELIIADEVHPNDAGADAIARATYAALAKNAATRSIIQD